MFDNQSVTPTFTRQIISKRLALMLTSLCMLSFFSCATAKSVVLDEHPAVVDAAIVVKVEAVEVSWTNPSVPSEKIELSYSSEDTSPRVFDLDGEADKQHLREIANLFPGVRTTFTIVAVNETGVRSKAVTLVGVAEPFPK